MYNYNFCKNMLKENKFYVDTNKDTLLHIIVDNNYCDLLCEILNDKNYDINKKNLYNWTPLHMACQNNNSNIVRILLLDNRINTNINIFFFVCFRQYNKCTEELINSNKINYNVKDSNGKTLIYCALANENYDIYYLLLSKNNIILTEDLFSIINNEHLNELIKKSPLDIIPLDNKKLIASDINSLIILICDKYFDINNGLINI